MVPECTCNLCVFKTFNRGAGGVVRSIPSALSRVEGHTIFLKKSNPHTQACISFWPRCGLGARFHAPWASVRVWPRPGEAVCWRPCTPCLLLTQCSLGPPRPTSTRREEEGTETPLGSVFRQQLPVQSWVLCIRFSQQKRQVKLPLPCSLVKQAWQPGNIASWGLRQRFRCAQTSENSRRSCLRRRAVIVSRGIIIWKVQGIMRTICQLVGRRMWKLNCVSLKSKLCQLLWWSF